MAAAIIAIQVDAKTAKVYAVASPEEQRKIQLVLSLWWQDFTASQRKSLYVVMNEVGALATAGGHFKDEASMSGHIQPWTIGQGASAKTARRTNPMTSSTAWRETGLRWPLAHLRVPCYAYSPC